jgi:GNAT superfamily N-acetyltransferase
VINVRRPRANEGERLREIAFRAKAHWGYDAEWVRQWVGRGDFSAAALARNETFVAETEGEVVAWAMLVLRGGVGWLEDLWVEPAWIGRGIGSELFRQVAARAREVGASRLEWEAEPNAVGFYQKVGGTYVRDSEETELGRVLRVMSVALDDLPPR